MNASELARTVAAPKGTVAVAIVDADGNIDICSPDRRRLFEAGSLTKTFLGTMLARLVVDHVVSLDTTVKSILGITGDARAITLGELVSHTSGLPRLAPDALRQPWWPRDPYRFYSKQRLLRVLPHTSLAGRGAFAYSNMGVDVLSVCIEAVTGVSTGELLRQHVFEPACMRTARSQPCSRRGLARGHAGTWLSGARRWHEPIVGAGGVDIGIDDLAAWLRLNVTSSDPAVRLAHDLSWMRNHDGRIWHNGATGCFQSIAIIEPGQRGIGALVAHGQSRRYSLTERVFAYLAG